MDLHVWAEWEPISQLRRLLTATYGAVIGVFSSVSVLMRRVQLL